MTRYQQTTVLTTFNPSGNSLHELKDKLNGDSSLQILVAFNTNIYASGPSTRIETGVYFPATDGMHECIVVLGRTYPLASFLCWWEIPTVTHKVTEQ